VKVELGEGVMASAPRPEQRKEAAAGAQKADLSALSAMLAQKWKSGGAAADSAEAIRAGQVRSFKIVQIDLEKKRIELELQA
jgi:small subunit ribosomal protein S1